MEFVGESLVLALEKATKETGRAIEEMDYEIINEKGSLFKAPKVIVKVNGFKKRGRIGILSGNVKMEEGELPPIIVPGENVTVKINGDLILKETKVYSTDNVEIIPNYQEALRNINIIISNNGMEAYLEVEYRDEKTYFIEDTDFSDKILIQGTLLQEKIPDRFTLNDVKDLIHINKIKYGLNLNRVEHVLSNGGRIQIAKGLDPEMAIDDKIDYLFKQEEKKPIEIEGKVDYYNVGQWEFVEIDEKLAEFHKGNEGKSGCDVFGNEIKPSNKTHLKFLHGPGCKFSNDKKYILADIKGLPSIKDGKLCVFPALVHNSDVDIKTGNIIFKGGDVHVRGNVKEGLKIEAGNNVVIEGYSYGSSISAGGDIHITRNVVAGSIRAGNNQLDEIILLKYLKVYSEFLNKLVSAYYEISKTGKLKKAITNAQIFNVILSSQLKNYKNLMKEGIVEIRKLNIKNEGMDIWNAACNVFMGIEYGKMNEPKNLILLLKKIKEYIITNDIPITPANVYIGYCQNTEIYATNNIEIKGKGSYNSIINCDNEVRFTGYPGVVRGGVVFGQRGVYCKEIGSDAGVLTEIKTTKDGIINAEIAYQNTVLVFDDIKYSIDSPSKKLKAFMHKGEIVVEKLKL